jgi:DNA-binding LacI/PurR family transcriptional regulator
MQKEKGYRNIYAELRRRISENIYAPGSKLPAERLLSEEWGCERTTVRRALALLEDEGLIIKKAGYGSVVAGAGDDKDAPLISFLVQSVDTQPITGLKHHHFISPVYNSFSEICKRNGYRSISMSISGARFDHSFNSILRQSSGIVLADYFPVEILHRTRELGVPCVLMSEREVGFRSVLCDNDSALMQTVAHLAKLGHKNIAYIGGDRIFLNARARADGFRRAIETYGLDDRKPIIDFAGWSVQNGYLATERILSRESGITAICTVNDYVALGAYRSIVDRGKKIPHDFSIAGFGDTIDPELSQISLTTIRIPYDRFARELFRSLVWELEHPYEDPATVLVEAELVVRATTGPHGS